MVITEVNGIIALDEVGSMDTIPQTQNFEGDVDEEVFNDLLEHFSKKIVLVTDNPAFVD